MLIFQVLKDRGKPLLRVGDNQMNPILKDGVLYIPMAAYGDGIVGDAMIPIGKDDPKYEYWLNQAMLEEQMCQMERKLNAWGGKPRRSKDG